MKPSWLPEKALSPVAHSTGSYLFLKFFHTFGPGGRISVFSDYLSGASISFGHNALGQWFLFSQYHSLQGMEFCGGIFGHIDD